MSHESIKDSFFISIRIHCQPIKNNLYHFETAFIKRIWQKIRLWIEKIILLLAFFLDIISPPIAYRKF